MPWTFNKTTKEIELPVGDTMAFDVNLSSGSYGAVVFAIFDEFGRDLVRVPVDVIDGKAAIRLANKHTRDLRPGRYKWNLRLVSSPARDGNGNVYANDTTDEVMTVFGPGYAKAPTIRLTKDGAYV